MSGVFGIDAHLAGADVFKEGVVLELIGVFFVARCVCRPGGWPLMRNLPPFAEIRRALSRRGNAR
jgi:hypothetical protein